MSNGMKTALIIGGTVVTTTVALDLLTGGAVRAAISEKMSCLTGGASEAAEAVADAVSDGAEAVADAVGN